MASHKSLQLDTVSLETPCVRPMCEILLKFGYNWKFHTFQGYVGWWVPCKSFKIYTIIHVRPTPQILLNQSIIDYLFQTSFLKGEGGQPTAICPFLIFKKISCMVFRDIQTIASGGTNHTRFWQIGISDFVNVPTHSPIFIIIPMYL